MTKLNHLDDKGAAHMVDIHHKDSTDRLAIAQGELRVAPKTIELILEGDTPKGDVLSTARIAGIMAAKSTSQLIPLCHPIGLTSIHIDLNLDSQNGVIYIEAQVGAHDRTGVEMEALTAVSVTALTLYDMLKAVDTSMLISGVQVTHKRGGKRDYDERVIATQTRPLNRPQIARSNPLKSIDLSTPRPLDPDRTPTPADLLMSKPSSTSHGRGFKVIAKGSPPEEGVSKQSFDELMRENPTPVPREERQDYISLGGSLPPSSLDPFPFNREDLKKISEIDFEDRLSRGSSSGDLMASCAFPGSTLLSPPVPEEAFYDDVESDPNASSWEESMFLEEVDEELTGLHPPSLSDAALAMGEYVREVSLNHPPLREYLISRPLECAYLLGYITPEYTSRCRVFVLERPSPVDSLSEAQPDDPSKMLALLFMYSGLSVPSVWTYGGALEVEAIIAQVYSELPRRLYINMEDHHLQSVRTHYALRNRKSTLRMGLHKSHYRPTGDKQGVVSLNHKDTGAIMQLYAQYPDHLFEPAQLGTGLYCGIRTQDNQLISVAGIHLLNPTFNIAAIGNIVTHNAHRGEGLASRCIHHIIDELFQGVEHIALNVVEDNLPAITCYRKFGFRMTSRILEASAKLR